MPKSFRAPLVVAMTSMAATIAMCVFMFTLETEIGIIVMTVLIMVGGCWSTLMADLAWRIYRQRDSVCHEAGDSKRPENMALRTGVLFMSIGIIAIQLAVKPQWMNQAGFAFGLCAFLFGLRAHFRKDRSTPSDEI